MALPLLATTIAGNRLLSMGPKADSEGGPSSLVIYPTAGLWKQAKKQGGAGRSLTALGGREDGEDYPCRGRQRYAALLGEGAAECRLRRDFLRQRAFGLSTAAGGAVRAS